MIKFIGLIVMILVTPKVAAKHYLLCSTNPPLRQLLSHLSQTKEALQSVSKFVALIVMNLVTPKAATKHYFLFNKPSP
jgi:hypothetical protein